MADQDAGTRGLSPKQKFLKLARDRFKQGQDAIKNQRQRELDDLRFYAGDQWPSDIKAARSGEGLTDGLPPVPARPCITINKTREPVRQVLNQERGADMGIQIVPADDFGDLSEPISETEITLREGLTRRIQRDSHASDARTWAFARATIAGVGYYGVFTRYAPGKTNDQEVYIHRFYNQSAVTLDPAHEQPDGSDCDWEFVGADIPWARYKAEYGTRNGKANKIADRDYTDDEWRALGEETPLWFSGEGDTRSVRVVDYYYTVRTPRTLCALADGSVAWEDELPDDLPDGAVVSTRTVVEKTIKFAKIDGCDDDVLEETDLLGPDMPIVKVLGEELQPYDHERRCEGMVRPMREPCQGFNAMISQLVETIALSPKPPIMVEEGQVEGYEAWYQAANTRTLPYLPFKRTNLDGIPTLSPPFALNRDAPIAPMATAIPMFDDFIQSTSLSRTAMGQVDSSVKSKAHAQLLKQESEQGTSNYMDNLLRSMRYEGQVVNNLLEPVYGRRPGRLARIVNGDGDAETVYIGQPMVRQNGRPVAVGEGTQGATTYTLTKDAAFHVAIKVSRNYDTRRQEEAATLSELLSSAPQLLTWFGDLFFANQDGPGHAQMAERAKAMLDPKILALIEQKKQGQAPSPALIAAQGQIQQLQQQLQQAAQIIQTKQVEEQAETSRKQMQEAAENDRAVLKAKTDITLAEMKHATELQLAEYTLRGQQIQAEIDARERAFGAVTQAASEDRQSDMAARTQARDHAHERGMAESKQAHEASESEAARTAAAVEAEAGRAAEAEARAADTPA